MGKRVFLNLPLYSSPIIKAGCFPAGRASDYINYLPKNSNALNAGSLGRLMSEVHYTSANNVYETDYDALSSDKNNVINMFRSQIDPSICNSLENPKINFKISDIDAWKTSTLYKDISSNSEYSNKFKLSITIEAYYKDATMGDNSLYTSSINVLTPINILNDSNNYINIPISTLIFKGKYNLSTDDKIYLEGISSNPSQSIALFTDDIELTNSKNIAYLQDISTYIKIDNIITSRRICSEDTFNIPLKISNPIQTSLGAYYPPVKSAELLKDKIMYLTNFTLDIPEQLTLLNPNREYLIDLMNGLTSTDELNYYTNHKWLPQFHEYCSKGHTFNIRKLNSSLIYTPKLVTPDTMSPVNTSSKAFIYGDYSNTILKGNSKGTPQNENSNHASVYEVVQQLLLDYVLFKMTFYNNEQTENINITLRDFLNNGITLEDINMEDITDIKFKLYIPSLDFISEIDTSSNRTEIIHQAAYLNQYSAINIKFNISLQTKSSNKGIYIGTSRVQRIFINKNEVLYFVADTLDTETYTLPKGTYYCKEGFTPQDLLDKFNTTSCSKCNGHGKHSGSTICDTCGGMGVTESRDVCPRCLGEGHSDNGQTCSNCKGAGYLYICTNCSKVYLAQDISDTCTNCGYDFSKYPAYESMCMVCNGNGVIEGTCEDCNGSGYIFSYPTCHTCNGNKTIETEVTCEDCNGTGKVSDISDLNLTINEDNSVTIDEDSKILENAFNIFCSILNI